MASFLEEYKRWAEEVGEEAGRLLRQGSSPLEAYEAAKKTVSSRRRLVSRLAQIAEREDNS